jgi:hypothetical protein
MTSSLTDLFLSDIPHLQTLCLDRFTVRVVLTGERYGREGCLTADETLVEFWDRRYEHTPLGQFTGARFFLTSLLAGQQHLHGLNLCGHVPAWTVGAADMAVVSGWLRHWQPSELRPMRTVTAWPCQSCGGARPCWCSA